MDEQAVNQLDNLLLQLGIETRELSQRKDELKQQIQICESNIEEKKDYIIKTQKTIGKLDEDIQQKQKTVKFMKENTKNLQKTGYLLLQYEKTLKAELEKRQDSYNQDLKMFQERTESYRNVFEQFKDRYCQNSLAQKLLKIQAENEDIERRIRAIEEQIMEKEREPPAALGEDEPVADGVVRCENSTIGDNGSLQIESRDETDPHQEPVMQRPEEQADEEVPAGDPEEKTAASESQTDAFSHGLWTKRNTGEDQMQDNQRSEEETEPEENMNVSRASDLMVETSEEKEEDGLQTNMADVPEDGASDGGVCPLPSPARIKATLTTPTFSLNNSPSSSPGRQESSDTKSPAFMFSMNSGPSTPAFSKLGCDFDVGSGGEEGSPFTFTSYFSDKQSKSPGSEPKLPGFLFDEAESRPEGFSFSFGTESPRQSSGTQDTAGPSVSFPFSFSFGKL